jgi:hypothetical protein
MVDIEKMTYLSNKYDLSYEEIVYLKILFDKDWKSLYIYENLTENSEENRVNERNTSTVYLNAIDKGIVPISNQVGLPLQQARISSSRRRKGITPEDILSLVNRKIIYRLAGRTIHELDAYELTDEYYNLFYIDFEAVFEDLREAYPSEIEVQGRTYPINLLEEKDCKLYLKLIRNNIDKHKEIIAKINCNKERLNYKIDRFIATKAWEGLSLEKKTVIDFSETL